MTQRLLEYWTDPARDNPILFCQLVAAETAIYLAEAAPESPATPGIRNDLDRQNEEHNVLLNRIGLKMATGTGKTVVMAMLIAWQNAEQGSQPERRPVRAAVPDRDPGLTIRDRLCVLRPEHDETTTNCATSSPPTWSRTSPRPGS